MKYNISGLSTDFQKGICELEPDYGFTVCDDGIKIIAQLNENLSIKLDSGVLTVKYSRPCEFYRGFVSALNKADGYERTDSANFERLGIMADNSRNAVFNIKTAKHLIRIMAACGYNYLELYTEDTYEIEDEPFFGYMRGRFTAAEIREIDSYAQLFGIELVPCIQTLAHLNALNRWGAYMDMFDFGDILIAEDERTYSLIEKMFKFAADNFKSRRINIGMDEAHMVGLGKYLDKHGYQNRFDIMSRHLQKVLEIADKYGFKCSMWSDMFFRLAFNGDYYAADKINKDVLSIIPKNVELIYWDYYNTEKSHYDRMIKSHQAIGNNIVFAGGAWKWMGFSPNNLYSLRATQAAFDSCIKNGIKDIFMTAWGDDGAECSIFAVLPSLIYASEKAYSNKDYKGAFKDITGYGFDEFLAIDYPNGYDMSKIKQMKSNYAKVFLYNDILNGIFDTLTPIVQDDYYKKALRLLKRAMNKDGCFKYLFETAYALTEVLSLKYDIGVKLRAAYKKDDVAELIEHHKTLQKIIVKTEKFYRLFRVQWLTDNKPFGIEVQDTRICGLIGRMKACAQTVSDYYTNKTKSIPELEMDILIQPDFTDNGEVRYNSWHKTISACIV